jgi:uncharacterized membrane protein YgdD (TMEM256/DUF423 family)
MALTPGKWLAIAALNGFLAVAAGAFGAHGLKSRLSGDMLAVFETAARYQMYHALALLAVAWLADRAPSRPQLRYSTAAGWSLTVGIMLFSGSLYALALSGVRGLGAITPIGGVAFLIGWLLLGIAALMGRTTSPRG